MKANEAPKQYISKSDLVAEIKKAIESFFEDNDRIYDEYGNYFYKNADNDYRFYHKMDEDWNWDEDRLSLDEMVYIYLNINNLEVKEVDLDDVTKEEMAQKYIDYTFKRHNIDGDSKEGQLIYYAYIHGMNQCLTQLRKQKGE